MNKKFISSMVLALLTVGIYFSNRVVVTETVVKLEEPVAVEQPIVKCESGIIEKPEKTGYIFIGDSRTVGMNNTVDIESVDDQWVVAKVGMGYDWLISDGWVQAQQIMSSNLQVSDWKIICNLGVNDLGNIDKYIDFYLENSKNYDITVVSVNPTIDEFEGVQCSQIEEFNDKIVKIPDIEYIDTYDKLIETGYDAPDGLHYDNKTYKKIYRIIMDEI